MSQYAWEPFLKRWSRELLEDEEFRAEVPAEVAAYGWLGAPPASDEQISAAEARLGKPLPPSYRQFLAVTNGGFAEQYFIDHLWSSETIDWLANTDPYWIEDARKLVERIKRKTQTLGAVPQYVANYVAPSELQTMLQIGVDVTGERYFLNPTVIAEDGEWQAIEYSRVMTSQYESSFAPLFSDLDNEPQDIAKASRYRSFWDLMQAKYAFSRYVSLVDIMNLGGDSYEKLRSTLQGVLRAAETTSDDLIKTMADQLALDRKATRDISFLMGVEQGMMMSISTLRILLSRLPPPDEQSQPF